MQSYGAAFARVYNLLWADFARSVAPRIFEFYSRNEIDPAQQSLLDVCCGTGQLALYFLERGYRVTGLDLSEAMLDHARENASMFVQAGQAHFVQADASAFTLDDHFGLVVSTYDALNHLTSLDALQSCFASVYAVTQAGGLFIFDLNTRLGLKRWNGITVQENDEALVVVRGIYDGGATAYTRSNGFVRDEDGRYTRFEETVYNTVFDLEAVRAALLDTGWTNVYFARTSDLAVPLDAPEEEGRVFVIASR
ncbi:MAG: methyltransferase domain-containing protein [Chloroflexi bacterium]|nr:methyltransferase domain-containing protein [Chloroflexota bacterium]